MRSRACFTDSNDAQNVLAGFDTETLTSGPVPFSASCCACAGDILGKLCVRSMQNSDLMLYWIMELIAAGSCDTCVRMSSHVISTNLTHSLNCLLLSAGF
jgi:hypothetical protein